MQDNDFIKISRPPKRDYRELLGNSSDFGVWVGDVEASVCEDNKYKKKSKRKRKNKKLMEVINNYEL